MRVTQRPLTRLSESWQGPVGVVTFTQRRREQPEKRVSAHLLLLSGV
jgi:hypothetical protein